MPRTQDATLLTQSILKIEKPKDLKNLEKASIHSVVN